MRISECLLFAIAIDPLREVPFSVSTDSDARFDSDSRFDLWSDTGCNPELVSGFGKLKFGSPILTGTKVGVVGLPVIAIADESVCVPAMNALSLKAPRGSATMASKVT